MPGVPNPRQRTDAAEPAAMVIEKAETLSTKPESGSSKPIGESHIKRLDRFQLPAACHKPRRSEPLRQRSTLRGERTAGLLYNSKGGLKEAFQMAAYNVYCNGRTNPYPINDAASEEDAIKQAQEGGFMPNRDVRNFRAVPMNGGPSADMPAIRSQQRKTSKQITAKLVEGGEPKPELDGLGN